jgi:hypothetical protein
MIKKDYKYDVVLSFAGEDRKYVKEVFKSLNENGIEVFYDEFKEDELWGKDLYVYLDNIYSKEAKFCLMFLSENYAKKLWTNHERQSAQARAFQQNEEYILPIKLDDTEIPGIRPTTGYLDGRKKTPREICELTLRKLRIQVTADKVVFDKDDDIPVVKRIISEKEMKNFLLESYQELKNAFNIKLEKLAKKNKHIKTKFREKSQSKFVAIIKTEEEETGCKIWIDKSGYNDLSILYSESFDESYESNSFNDSATVEEDGYEIYFNISGMFLFSIPIQEEIDIHHASVEDLIKYYWSRLISNLE